MVQEYAFKSTLYLVIALFMIIKIKMTKKYVKVQSQGNRYSGIIQYVTIISTIFMLFLPIIYSFSNWIDLYSVQIPNGIRISAILLYLGLIYLMIIVLQTLGLNIDTTHEERSLVITGPYKHLRHPLYSIFCSLSILQFIISANLLLGVGIPLVFWSVLLRINHEEKILITEYGDQYRTYINNSSKLIPKIY